MNGPRKLERKSSSKEALMKKTEAKKTSPRNPLKELNGGSSVPPPFRSSEAPRGGCFGFLLSSSSSKGSSKLLARTPRSAPPKPRMVNSKCSRKAFRYQTVEKAASRSDLEVSNQLGAKKNSKSRTPNLLKKWNRSNPSATGEENEEKLDLEDGLRGKVRSCSASTPQKSLPLGFTSTPTLAKTPPIEASISPEVPIGAFEVAATPVCFATGHVMTGVHDRRKCRPRGILNIGEKEEPEVARLRDGKADTTRSSLTPPIAEAAIHWLSSPSGNLDSGAGTSPQSSSRAPCPAEASVNWLVSPIKDEDEVFKARFFSEQGCFTAAETSVHNGIWKLSPSDSTMRGSPKFIGLLGLNDLGFERTPSSGISVQKTPSTGGSISPFSIILERVAKASKHKLVKTRQDLHGQQHGFTIENSALLRDSWINGNTCSTPSSYLCSKKQLDVSPIKMGKMKEVLGSSKLATNEISVQAPLSAHSFQFDCPPLSLDSVDLSHFQMPSLERTPSPKDKDEHLQSSGIRISWREGLVSRIFDMGELDCCNWISDDEGNLNDNEDDKAKSISNMKIDKKSRSSGLEFEEDQLIPASFQSVEVACESAHVKSDAKVPPTEHVSFAESISTDGPELVSFDDSDWTLFYKNHLFEV